jgi:hypothetical protein
LSALASVGRVSDFDLTGIIQYQRDSIREHKYSMIGRLTDLRLGVDDRAEYTRGAAWQRICAQSKVVGLTLRWSAAEAPYVAFANDKQTVLFPDGMPKPPKIEMSVYRLINAAAKDLPPGLAYDKKGELVADNKEGKVVQSIFDFASGSLTGRDNSRFVILQPVEQLVMLANVASTRFKSTGTMLDCYGRATFDGRYPFLLVSPFTKEAYLAGGRFSFDAL